MPAVLGWLAGLGLTKLAGLVAGIAAAGMAFYHYSFEICLMGSMICVLFSMFGFKLAQKGVLFFIALYIITQGLGAAI
jgi:uncharacterized membrane protein